MEFVSMMIYIVVYGQGCFNMLSDSMRHILDGVRKRLGIVWEKHWGYHFLSYK